MTAPVWLPTDRLDELVQNLRARGYRTVGPVIRDGTVTLGDLAGAADLPWGQRDEQGPGSYRLTDTPPGTAFGVVNGPASPKGFFFPARETLVELERTGPSFRAREIDADDPPLALIGIRPCDLAAIAVQDRVFLGAPAVDTHYARRRAASFLVVTNCTRSAATCFCTSMGTGPAAGAGHDVVLTEIAGGFIAEAGSEIGYSVLTDLGLPPAGEMETEAARRQVAACAAAMERQMETSDLPGLLYEERENPRWADVARRCLSCGNCTLVCPTCFCHTMIEEPELDGTSSRRVRLWDSCFSYEHAHVHGKNFRPAIRHRYRQWLTHKLAAWLDQFGTSGCVGCGRCITWCPSGIDLTEEVAAIRAARGKR